MSRKLTSHGSLTAFIAAAALSCGAARAEPLFEFRTPPAQSQITPQYEAAPAAQSHADEDTQLAPRLQRQTVNYTSNEAPGTVIIDSAHTYLYYLLGNGQAIRYGIGVGRAGFTWSGVKQVVRKAEWPDWYPPAEMVARQPYLPRMVAGGPGNPLGARAMYIGGTEYRIHGTNDPTTIGKHVSSGCIRLTNENVEDLYSRVQIGAKVIVLPPNGAPTREVRTPAPGWQAKAQAAIAAAKRQRSSADAPAEQSRGRMSWNVSSPSGLY